MRSLRLGSAQRVMVRTSRGAARPIWLTAYRIVARFVVVLLRWGDPDAAAYLRGGWARGEVTPGLSDIDLALVAPRRHAGRARRRWRRFIRLLPAIQRLVQLGIYDDDELRLAVEASTLTATSPVHLPPAAPRDEAGLRLRPGIWGPLREWRRLAGPERLPPERPLDPQERNLHAWLELQAVWRDAFLVCRHPELISAPHLALKLVTEPARIWLALAEGRRVRGRREILELARSAIPEEEEVFSKALGWERTLPRCPDPPLREALSASLRLSNRLTHHLTAAVEPAGATSVPLIGGADTELALQPDAAEPLAGLSEADPALLPLADWRAVVWPLFPDDAFAVVDGDPADPRTLRAAVEAAGSYGPYPALLNGQVMVLTGPGVLRAMQCRLTDPVSFALIAGSNTAHFPAVAGWSALDTARRAVLEHRSWLGPERVPDVPLVEQWALAQWRTSDAANETLGWLLSALRAGLFLDSMAQGEPQLALTVAAAGRSLDARLGGSRCLGQDAAETYRKCRLTGGAPSGTLVAELREAVLGLPAFAF